MIDDETENRRRELCDRFRESLGKPVSERFFDEDELVDLFDYAGDMADDYLKMEVLMCGARLYPESELLKQRRAIFYTFISDDAAAKFLDDNTQETSPIWEIMRLRSRAPQGRDAENAIRYLLDGVDRLDDEEVIQLVELASSLGVYDWLVANEALLRKKADYLPILLYELGVVSELNHSYENAVRYLEELTESEPFSAYYWFMLAQDYDMLDKREQALSAVDYSLAVDPENKDALQLRARMLMGNEETQPEAEAIIRKLAKKYPDDVDVQRVAAFISFANGNVAASRETMRQCLDRFPGDRAVLSDAVGTGLGDLPSVLDRFYKATDERDEDTWLDWAEDLKDCGLFEEARQVMEAYDRNSPEPMQDRSVYVDTLFILQHFDMLCRIFDEDTDHVLLDGASRYANIVICLISRLKCGQTEKARELLRYIEQHDSPEIACTADALQRITAMALVNDIRGILSKNRKTDWHKFDPFGMWNNPALGDL